MVMVLSRMGGSSGPRKYSEVFVVSSEILTFCSRKEWHVTNPEYPALSWYDLQGMLERARFDVLLILDCCHAAGAVTKGSASTMEILAGCSREAKAVAPGGGRVIGSPFTHTLIEHLEKGAENPHGLIISELQTRLSFDKILENQSPVHVVLAGHFKPIKLKPIHLGKEEDIQENKTSEPSKPGVRAILAINFREDQLPKPEDFFQWLDSQRPKEVDKVEVTELEMGIEGLFRSYSTLVLLSMPLSMWAHFQESPGCSLVGFVQSSNDLMKQHRKRDNDRRQDVDSKYEIEENFFPFQYGAQEGSLLEKGADSKVQGYDYNDALQAASHEGRKHLVKVLLEEGANPNAQSREYGNALYVASQRGHEAVAKLLLDNGADVNAQGRMYGNALQAASANSHEQIVRLLLDAGADVNAQGGMYGNVLQAASERGHKQIVRLLLDKGADVNAQGGSYSNALYVASERGHEAIVKMLLDKGADVNAQGGKYGHALQAASAGGHKAVVKLLLERGADVNAKGGYYSNALQAALYKGNEALVKLLLNEGADVNAQGGSYSNALQAASDRGYREIVKLLLDKGANVNAQGGYYSNALQAASARGYREIVKLLLDKGANVNAQGGYYSNAFQAASARGYSEIVELLVDKGAVT
jgi:ankyrin repeat protein